MENLNIDKKKKIIIAVGITLIAVVVLIILLIIIMMLIDDDNNGKKLLIEEGGKETEFAPIVETVNAEGVKKEVDVVDSAALLTGDGVKVNVSKLDVENICKFMIQNDSKYNISMDAYAIDSTGTKPELYNVINVPAKSQKNYESSVLVDGRPVPTFVGQSVLIYEPNGSSGGASQRLEFERTKIIIKDTNDYFIVSIAPY